MDLRKLINEHPKVVVAITSLALLMLVATLLKIYLPGIRSEMEYRRWQRRLSEKRRHRVNDTTPIVKGNLVFQQIPLKVKRISGEVGPLQKRGATVKCTDSLDVMWTNKAMYFMREKGLFEQVLSAQEARISDLEWDGRNIWISLPQKGIWILDASGTVIAKVNREYGLPPGERGLLLHTIGPGKMFAVGSFGRFGRGWCAVVEFNEGNVAVNVFHHAKKILPVIRENRKRFEKDPDVVFKPYWIREYLALPSMYDPNYVRFEPCWVGAYRTEGRRTIFIARCAKKYKYKHSLRYPLQVDLETLKVQVSSRPMTSVTEPKPTLGYNGKIYFPGKVWKVFDPNTRNMARKMERLVIKGQLPRPYSSMAGYWVSAHYGLAGWTGNHELYQIRISQEEHDILAKSPASTGQYFHTFAFKDGNSPSLSLDGIETVKIATGREGSLECSRYNPHKSRGYFPLGTYRAWGYGDNYCWFEPIEVTEDSPVRLVFKVKEKLIKTSKGVTEIPPAKPVVYSGQVVNAVTGKPVAGASVRVGTFQGPKRVIKTDSNGRFEVTVQTKAPHYEFEAFKENYFSVNVDRYNLDKPRAGRVEIGTMLLFPAAKLKLAPLIGGDVSPELRLTAGFASVRPWVVIEQDASQIWSSTFSSMYGYLTDRGSIPVPSLQINREDIIPVPAGVNFKLLLITKYESLCPPNLPQTINLKQGQMLDLGIRMFEPAVKIFLKLVNSSGEPIKGAIITKSLSNAYNFTQSIIQGRTNIHITDKNGRTRFYVEPDSEQKFKIYRDNIKWELLKTVSFKIGSDEDAGKEFIVEL